MEKGVLGVIILTVTTAYLARVPLWEGIIGKRHRKNPEVPASPRSRHCMRRTMPSHWSRTGKAERRWVAKPGDLP